ncbi:MAG: hypothetical protein ACRDV7_13610 [Acidimicrobiia bacterium]
MANISTDDHRGRSVLELDSGGHPDEWIVPTNELSPPDASTTNQRTHGRRVLVAAAAIVVVIAAAGIAIRIEDQSRVATTAPTLTTSRASATIEQYGSVVSEHSAAIQAWEESCSDMECLIPQYAHEHYVALRTLLVNFNRALAELPSPPDEIATLVDRTKDQVNDAINGIDQGLPCGAASPQAFLASPSCYDEWSEAEAEAAYKRLPPVFAAWSPYT